MRNRRIGSLLMVTILVMFIITNSICIVSADNTPQIKNVIFMIPDGGGFALYDFANAVKEAGGFDDESFQDLSKYSTKITKNSMVEGSKVDAGGHAKDIVKAVSEYIAFDEAFAVALNFAKERADTVVIVAPDHDTGGLILPDPDGVGGNPDWTQYADAVAEVRQGINSDKISWASDQHTARRGGVWMYAPEGIEPPRGLATIPGDNSENRSKIIDNTEIAPYLANLMGLDLEAATKELFVDVTDLGTFNPDNKTFTFNDWDISIKENQSVATVNGHTIDLEGKVAVYSNDRFYVPSTLLPRAIDIKNARYKDDLTGRVLVKGQLDKAFAGQEASLILSKQGAQRLTKENIGYIAQTTVNKDGAYVFKFNFYGDISQYELRMYLGDRMVTDSVTVATASYTWLDSDVLLVQKGNVVSSEVIIDNHYDLEGLSYLMTLSFYDNNNKLIKVIKSDNIKPVGNKITIDYLNTEIPQGAATVKAFVWSNLTEMIPLCKSDAITVE